MPNDARGPGPRASPGSRRLPPRGGPVKYSHIAYYATLCLLIAYELRRPSSGPVDETSVYATAREHAWRRTHRLPKRGLVGLGSIRALPLLQVLHAEPTVPPG